MIRYKSGRGYVLHDSYSIKTHITGYNVQGEFFELREDGWLYFYPGFSWNGAGATWWQSVFLTRKSTLRPSMVHDALCELLESGALPQHEKALVDLTYFEICKENGINKARAAFYLYALLSAGDYSQRKEVIEEAP